MKIEMRPLAEIRPYANNARKIPKKAVNKVAASLEEFGWRQPIVVDRDGVIVVGHVRLLAAQQLRWSEAPVHVADNLTPEQIRAYRLMDNRSHEEADWDLKLLAPELAELQSMSFDLNLTGFNVDQIDTLLHNPMEEETANYAPPLPDIPVTVSRENAWRFHEDALRDMKGLMDAHGKTCAAMGIIDETSASAAEHLQQVASEKLGIGEIDSKYLAVAEASRSAGVDLGDRFAPSHRWLSKFAHPTAGLVHGITHQTEACHQLQAVCTTQGVYFAAQSTLAIEAQLGIPPLPD